MVIRHVEQADRDQWDRLYRGYADYYQVETDMPRRDRLFAWLRDPGHVCCGLVAETGRILGLSGSPITAACHRRCVVPRLVFWMICLSILSSADRGLLRRCYALLTISQLSAGGRWCAGSPVTTIIGRAAFMTACHIAVTGSPTR